MEHQRAWVATRKGLFELRRRGTGSDASWAVDRVHFLGARTDARRILGFVDVYVHPSRGEGLGLAVVEAMLAGVPVIVTNEGAFPEYVTDGVTGLMFPGGDVSALVARIAELIQDRTRAARLGRTGREHCLKMFSPARFADEMTSVLEKEAARRLHR